MTKEDIKKALELCFKDEDCAKCPYWISNKYFHCLWTLQQDSLALITEQEKEIERLRTTLGQCNAELNSALESLKSQCREIGELKAEVEQAKIDVLNKLRRRAWQGYQIGMYIVSTQEIDEIINEAQNEN